jgi:transposase
MEMHINVPEWVLYVVVVWLAIGLADTTLALYQRYLEWKIKKEKDPHEVSKVKCHVCSHSWVAVRPVGLTELECPNCGRLCSFENE